MEGIYGFSKMSTPSLENREPSFNPVTASIDWWDLCARSAEIFWTRLAGRRAIAAAAASRTEDLIDFAREASPYYRGKWRALPHRRLALRELPVVHKHDLMSRFDDWVTDRSVTLAAVDRFLADKRGIGEPFLGKYIVWKSSGTTGEPGVFVEDRSALTTYDALLAVQTRALEMASRYAIGIGRGDGAALVVATGDHFASIASWQRMSRGTPWPNARAFSILDPLPSLVAALNEYQPAFVASYPTTLAMLADEQRDERLHIAPACIWSGGEYLSSSARASVERAFGATVVNEYGASECMNIAHSCSRGSLHLNADWVVLEAVDRNYQPTPVGEPSHTVLLTNLANRVQPIVRYDLGDSVTVQVSPCPCGNALPVIRPEGRRDDVLSLRARDGSTVRLLPLALTTVLEEAIANHDFQLVQTAPDEIEVRLRLREAAERSAQWDAARAALRKYLASQSLGNVQLHLDLSEPMSDLRSGKVREVIGMSTAVAPAKHKHCRHVGGPQ